MFFPFWEWEGYINTKSQAININGITKAEKGFGDRGPTQ